MTTSGRLPSGGELTSWLSEVGDIDLDSAHEELRVAGEELRAQHEEIVRLSDVNRSAEARRAQLVAALPVAVITTHASGTITRANVAAGALLGISSGQLVGKPLQAFVDVRERSYVRTLFSRGPSSRRTPMLITLIPRARPPILTEAVMSPSAGDGEQGDAVTWVFLPAREAQPSSADADVARLATALLELSQLPVVGEDLRAQLVAVPSICADLVKTTAVVSLTVGAPAEPDVLVSDDEWAQTVDGVQMQAGEGPSQEAWERSASILSGDLAVDERWPSFIRRAGDLGVNSVLAVPMLSANQAIGVVNAYSKQPNAFDDADVLALETIAQAVSMVVLHFRRWIELHRTSAQLEEALTSRAVIDQAKGVMMAWYGGDATAAFERLVRTSRDHNIKLRDLAVMVVLQAAKNPARTSPTTRATPSSDTD